MAFPDPIINGLGTAQMNERRLTFTPFVGGQQGGVYEGPDAVIFPLVAQSIAAGYSVEYNKSQSPISKLTFSAVFNSVNGGVPVAPNSDYTDTWELVRNSVQKELLESDHPMVSALGASNFQILKNLISGSGPDTWNGDPTLTFNNNPSADYSAAVYLWALHQAGVTTVEIKQPILKLTRTTSPLYDAAWAVNRTDTLFLTASMEADSGVPSTFAIPLVALATQLMARSGGLIAQARADGLNLQFGWLKDLTGSTKHGRERIQYNITYSFGLYDANLYGVPS